MTLSVDDNESVTRQYVIFLRVEYPQLLLIPLYHTRYIGDLEQQVKSLENELAAARRIGHASREPSAPAGPSDSQDHREHSPNFIEGGGIRSIRQNSLNQVFLTRRTVLCDTCSRTQNGVNMIRACYRTFLKAPGRPKRESEQHSFHLRMKRG